jgi:hypothetical protein
MKKSINAQAQTVTFTFDGLAPITFNPGLASVEARQYAMLHGFCARIGDNAAIQKSEENNFTVTEGMRREAVMELVNHYESGTEQWNLRAAGPRKVAQNPAILKLAEALGLSYEATQAKLVDDAMAALTA